MCSSAGLRYSIGVCALVSGWGVRAAYPVVHEQVFDDEVGHDGLHGGGELIWGQHGDVAQGDQRGDELLWDICVQTTRQRLGRGEGERGSRVTTTGGGRRTTRLLLARRRK